MSKSVGVAIAACCLGLACTSAGSSKDAGDDGPCALPAGADTFDSGADQGCKPSPRFEECQVPNGATIDVEPDGGLVVPDGSTCSNLCASTEFELTCTGPAEGGTSIPAPASSLSCRILTLPTPSNVAYYCCACAN